MKALIKEKENVLTYLELVNMKNAYLLQSEELKRKIVEAKREKLMEEKEYKKKSTTIASIVGDCIRTRKNMDPTSVKKTLEDYEQMLKYYTLMKTKTR